MREMMPLTWPSGPGEAQVCDQGWSLLGVDAPRLLKGIGASHECKEGTIQALSILSEDTLDFSPDCIALET